MWKSNFTSKMNLYFLSCPSWSSVPFVNAWCPLWNKCVHATHTWYKRKKAHLGIECKKRTKYMGFFCVFSLHKWIKSSAQINKTPPAKHTNSHLKRLAAHNTKKFFLLLLLTAFYKNRIRSFSKGKSFTSFDFKRMILSSPCLALCCSQCVFTSLSTAAPTTTTKTWIGFLLCSSLTFVCDLINLNGLKTNDEFSNWIIGFLINANDSFWNYAENSLICIPSGFILFLNATSASLNICVRTAKELPTLFTADDTQKWVETFLQCAISFAQMLIN